MKKVLVLCTGNSCRSIIAEGLINKYLEGVKAYSAGVNPSGRVNENAKKVLMKEGAWDEDYHSKDIDEVMDIDFDLVVTVCDNAKETCPTFPKKVKTIHIGFEDPDGKEYEEFEKLAEEMKEEFLEEIKRELKIGK